MDWIWWICWTVGAGAKGGGLKHVLIQKKCLPFGGRAERLSKRAPFLKSSRDWWLVPSSEHTNTRIYRARMWSESWMRAPSTDPIWAKSWFFKPFGVSSKGWRETVAMQPKKRKNKKKQKQNQVQHKDVLTNMYQPSQTTAHDDLHQESHCHFPCHRQFGQLDVAHKNPRVVCINMNRRKISEAMLVMLVWYLFIDSMAK